jgi:predicted transcriptional regulator
MSEEHSQALVAQILSSYLSNNTVSPDDLYNVISTVKRAFGDAPAQFTGAIIKEEMRNWQPAVPLKRSITANAITCLCCGGKFKALKRHLNAEHKMTPAEYRTAFKLKADYPLVAPSYAERRSALAKSLGLGRVTRKRRDAGIKRSRAKSGVGR